MPWSGSSPSQQFTRTDGVRTGDTTWQQAAAAPVDIEADDHDTHDTDLKDGINACLKKDGGNTASANIPMGGFTLTNIAAATARTMPARFSDVQDGKAVYYPTVGGTADDITLTGASAAITAYAAGQCFYFINSGGPNTGAVTVDVNGVGPKDVKRNDGSFTALSAGDMPDNAICTIFYDGTRFLLLSSNSVSDGVSLISGAVISWANGDVTITHSSNALAFAGATAGYSFDDDVLLPSAGVINWNSGDITITHSANTLAFAGGTYTFAGAVTPASSDGSTLGTSALMWSDLFLASGGVINFNDGDVTLTHSANTLAFAGASSGYTFDALVSSAASVLAHSATAIPAGGTAGAGLRVSSTSNFGVFFGSGAPTLAAARGSLYLRSDASELTSLYVNLDGSTSWGFIGSATEE